MDYGTNPEKTKEGELISCYACDHRTADAEFLLSKQEYMKITGRDEINNVIAYQVRQSFKPGELTPEEANQIGYDFASRFLKGKHAFIVCTHTDKKHIHNHIYWNSTTLDCTRKFRDFLGSGRAVARLSDLICTEHQLSVIAEPKRGGTSYNKWRGYEAKQSKRDILRTDIDAALSKKPHSFDGFLTLLQDAGYEIKEGKNISLRKRNFAQFIRLNSLGDSYSENEIRACIVGQRQHTPRKRKSILAEERVQTVIDIQARLAAGNGEGFRRWATVENLKRMAKTKLYMDEHHLTYGALSARKAELEARKKEVSDKVEQSQTRLAEINVLKTHIVNYTKTRDVFQAYKKSGYSKKFLAEHEADIIIHRAAKKAFDEMGLKKLPTIKSLSVEFSELLSEKKDAYAELKAVRDELRVLSVHKANYEELRDLEKTEQRKEQEYGRE